MCDSRTVWHLSESLLSAAGSDLVFWGKGRGVVSVLEVSLLVGQLSQCVTVAQPGVSQSLLPLQQVWTLVFSGVRCGWHQTGLTVVGAAARVCDNRTAC